MRIGLDFDGTVAIYDELFYECAVDAFGMPPEVPVDKSSIRDWFWRTDEGKRLWILLQGQVYGVRANEAQIAPGLGHFLEACRVHHVQVCIVSHKTQFPVIGPRVNLRKSARQWLERFCFHSGFGIGPEDVFFESSRAEKLQRIAAQRCSVFVDDLKEVFLDPAFPPNVEKLLYAPVRDEDLSGEVKLFSSWDAIRGYCFRPAA